MCAIYKIIAEKRSDVISDIGNYLAFNVAGLHPARGICQGRFKTDTQAYYSIPVQGKACQAVI